MLIHDTGAEAAARLVLHGSRQGTKEALYQLAACHLGVSFLGNPDLHNDSADAAAAADPELHVQAPGRA